jgi:hypothetical protein
MNSRYLWIIVSCLLIVACATAIHPGDPLWKIAIVKKTCRNFDGRYIGQDELYKSFIDFSRWPTVTRFSNLQTIKQFSAKTLTDEELQKLGAVSAREKSNAQWKYADKQRKHFDATAITEIKRTNNGWQIELQDNDGVVYFRNVISEKNENVGCDAEGRLVLRQFTVHQGGEGTPGHASAVETTFSKSEDDGIKVQKLSRYWEGSMELPPIRETQRVLEFSSMKP